MTRYRWRQMMEDALRFGGPTALRRLYERHTGLFSADERRRIRVYTPPGAWARVARYLRQEIRAFRGQTWKQHNYQDPASKAMRYLWLPARTR